MKPVAITIGLALLGTSLLALPGCGTDAPEPKRAGTARLSADGDSESGGDELGVGGGSGDQGDEEGDGRGSEDNGDDSQNEYGADRQNEHGDDTAAVDPTGVGVVVFFGILACVYAQDRCQARAQQHCQALGALEGEGDQLCGARFSRDGFEFGVRCKITCRRPAGA